MTTEAKILAAIDTAGGQANAATIANGVGIEAAMARQYLRTLVDKKLVREVSQPGKRIEYARAGTGVGDSNQKQSIEPADRKPGTMLSPEEVLADAQAEAVRFGSNARVAPYLPAIVVLRREKKFSLKEVAQWLRERGVNTTPGSISKLMQRAPAEKAQ